MAEVEIRYVDKTVEVPRIEYVEKVVEADCGRLKQPIIYIYYINIHIYIYVFLTSLLWEVPQITYEERIIEVPQREVREIIKQVPRGKLSTLRGCIACRFPSQ